MSASSNTAQIWFGCGLDVVSDVQESLAEVKEKRFQAEGRVVWHFGT